MRAIATCLLPTATLLCALLLAACGGGAAPAAEQPLAAATPTLAADESAADSPASAFPVTIEHKFGSTTLDTAPQRVVVIGYNEQDPYFALGVAPVAVRYWYGDAPNAIFPWAEDEAAGATPDVLDMPFGNLNLEAITALEPDLISALYSGITEEEYQTLSQIAPTLAQPDDYIDFGMPWQEVVRVVGQATGTVAEAEARVQEVEAQFEATRAQHPEFAGRSVAVVYSNGDGSYGFYTAQDPRGRFFTELGFEIPTELVEVAGESFFATVSAERLDLLDRDLIVFLGLQFLEGGREAVEADPLFSQLAAVQEGRIVFVPNEFDDALQFNTVLSQPFLLENVVPLLADALAGASGNGKAQTVAALPVPLEQTFGSRTLAAPLLAKQLDGR